MIKLLVLITTPIHLPSRRKEYRKSLATVRDIALMYYQILRTDDIKRSDGCHEVFTF